VIDVLSITLKCRVDLMHDVDVQVIFERIVSVSFHMMSIFVSEDA